MNLWLFIGRLNPPHIWHLSTIDKIIQENDFVLILIWSQKNRNDKNPLDFKQIKNILSKKYLFNSKLKIVELKDDNSDLIWLYSIYKILYENFPWIYSVNFYAWDLKNDSAYNVINNKKKFIPDYKFNFIEESRKNSIVNYSWNKYDISATNLRKFLREWNYSLASEFCDKKMLEEIKKYF